MFPLFVAFRVHEMKMRVDQWTRLRRASFRRASKILSMIALIMLAIVFGITAEFSRSLWHQGDSKECIDLVNSVTGQDFDVVLINYIVEDSTIIDIINSFVEDFLWDGEAIVEELHKDEYGSLPSTQMSVDSAVFATSLPLALTINHHSVNVLNVSHTVVNISLSHACYGDGITNLINVFYPHGVFYNKMNRGIIVSEEAEAVFIRGSEPSIFFVLIISFIISAVVLLTRGMFFFMAKPPTNNVPIVAEHFIIQNPFVIIKLALLGFIFWSVKLILLFVISIGLHNVCFLFMNVLPSRSMIFMLLVTNVFFESLMFRTTFHKKALKKGYFSFLGARTILALAFFKLPYCTILLFVMSFCGSSLCFVIALVSDLNIYSKVFRRNPERYRYQRNESRINMLQLVPPDAFVAKLTPWDTSVEVHLLTGDNATVPQQEAMLNNRFLHHDTMNTPQRHPVGYVQRDTDEFHYADIFLYAHEHSTAPVQLQHDE
ncbi:hypothetical protein PCE1_000790 [Barthelona sp. PCE]